jgi:competence protein ComEC
LRAQWLLVPHHGSKTSSSPDFLDAVQPRFAMVQAGYRNRFGHPASPVLVRYDERKIAVIDTPHCGASRWQSWQADQIACEREVQRRYWRHIAP